MDSNTGIWIFIRTVYNKKQCKIDFTDALTVITWFLLLTCFISNVIGACICVKMYGIWESINK